MASSGPEVAVSTNGPAPHRNDGSPPGRPRGECHHTIPGTDAPEDRTFCPTAVSRDSKRQSAATPMPARKRDAEWEQTRKLRNLPKPQLSTKDAVRRRSGSVAGNSALNHRSICRIPRKCRWHRRRPRLQRAGLGMAPARSLSRRGARGDLRNSSISTPKSQWHGKKFRTNNSY